MRAESSQRVPFCSQCVAESVVRAESSPDTASGAGGSSHRRHATSPDISSISPPLAPEIATGCRHRCSQAPLFPRYERRKTEVDEARVAARAVARALRLPRGKAHARATLATPATGGRDDGDGDDDDDDDDGFLEVEYIELVCAESAVGASPNALPARVTSFARLGSAAAAAASECPPPPGAPGPALAGSSTTAADRRHRVASRQRRLQQQRSSPSNPFAAVHNRDEIRRWARASSDPHVKVCARWFSVRDRSGGTRH